MSNSIETQAVLIDGVWPEGDKAIRLMSLALAGSLALWASAKLQVPFYPVPMTMQTFVVLVLGMAYGWKLGAATVLLYIAKGALGLPVFAGTPERGVGLAYMMGPTGGYLLGFVVSAAAVGWLGNRGWDRHIITTLVAMTFGTAGIFACGLVWLAILVGWQEIVLEAGLWPFLPGAAFKIALAAFIVPAMWRLSRRH